MVYRQFIMIPVATNYYDLCHVHSNLGEFQYRFIMQKFRFSVPPLLPAFLPVTWSHRDRYLLYVFMYSWVYNSAPQLCFSRCMVDYTLMTDQMTTIFVFHFIWGHRPYTTRLNLLPIFKQGRTSSDFNENQPKVGKWLCTTPTVIVQSLCPVTVHSRWLIRIGVLLCMD